MLLDINKIKVEKRIRKAYGDIEGLASSIKELGLLNPPVVTPDYELVAGERRLKAMKFLNYQQVEVNIMTFEDYESKFRAEIEENEQRLEFTFSERMEWARELEQIERGKAKGRQAITGLKNLGQEVESFPPSSKGDTRDIVAKQTGFGSGKQYEKAKFISDNADEETIKQLDENQISVHAAYQKLKNENQTLAEKVKTLETKKPINEEPNLKQKIKEVEQERDRYINQVNELEKKNISVKDEDGQELSPESKLLIKKRPSIQDCSYELIDLIKFMSITPPYDLPDIYVSDLDVVFSNVIKEVTAAKLSLTNTNKINYVDAVYTVIEKGEINE